MEIAEEEDIVFRTFNEVQGNPKKHEQFAETLAQIYIQYPERFVQQYSDCIYQLLAFKGSNKVVDNLLSFTASVAHRCKGRDRIPPLAPLIIEVVALFVNESVGLIKLYKNKRSVCSPALSIYHKSNPHKICPSQPRRPTNQKVEDCVHGAQS